LRPFINTLRRKLLGRALLVGGALVAIFCLTGTAASAAPATVGPGFTAASFTLQQADWRCNSIIRSATVKLVFQCDGNLVLYLLSNNTPLWATGTYGSGVTDLDWSQSGYLKLLNSSGGTVCTVGALSPAPGGIAQVQNDGNFVFYDTSGNPTWYTATYGPRQGNVDYCYT